MSGVIVLIVDSLLCGRDPLQQLQTPHLRLKTVGDLNPAVIYGVLFDAHLSPCMHACMRRSVRTRLNARALRVRWRVGVSRMAAQLAAFTGRLTGCRSWDNGGTSERRGFRSAC